MDVGEQILCALHFTRISKPKLIYCTGYWNQKLIRFGLKFVLGNYKFTLKIINNKTFLHGLSKFKSLLYNWREFTCSQYVTKYDFLLLWLGELNSRIEGSLKG